ncbi:PLP-dependent aminotransferase family protein [Nocardia brasiliensis]|uniref:aminotransferase-like domain-containing protein n=1 Tax=Nocardia brasiliensis TaxID=37326 RepID=UPI002458CDCC|nr:PLP-dependent aminotransferase family protein [Nocardia brasiliensis]
MHESISDPGAGSLSFLNEAMVRYPDAISFAPGAPHPEFFDELDLEAAIESFVGHLVQNRGITAGQARKLLYEYGPSRGLISDIVARVLEEDEGISADPKSIVITVGAQEGLFLVLRLLFASSSTMLAVTNPCYSGILGAARVLGIPLVPIPESDDGIDTGQLADRCTAARRMGTPIRALYIAPDFGNPGGSRMPMSARQELLRLATRFDFLVIEDNAYGFTANDDDVIPCLKALDVEQRVVHIGTYSKTCFPGARVGYVLADQTVDAGPQRLADEISTLKGLVTVNTSPISQAVIGGTLLARLAGDGSHRAATRRRAERYQRNLQCLTRELNRRLGGMHDIRWNHPAGGFFVRLSLPVLADAALLDVSATRYRVLWTPMAPFYLDASGDRQLRLSCSYLDTEQIVVGVERLATFLAEEVL